MDTSFLILMVSGRTEKIIAERYELETETNTKRLVYKFYTEKDTTARCFFACEDIMAIIPSDMQDLTSTH